MGIGRLFFISPTVHNTCALWHTVNSSLQTLCLHIQSKKNLNVSFVFFFLFSSVQKFYDRLHDRNINISIYFIVLPTMTHVRAIFQLYCIGQYYWL